MITSEQIKDVVLPLLAARKEQLHEKMLTCEFEKLATYRMAIDEYKSFENFLERELKKESSEFLKQFNKV